jgi:hypothetical protein
MDSYLVAKLRPQYKGIAALCETFEGIEIARNAEYIRNVRARKPGKVYALQRYLIGTRLKTSAENLEYPQIALEVVREEGVDLPYVLLTIFAAGFARIVACPQDFTKEQLRTIDLLCGILAQPTQKG